MSPLFLPPLIYFHFKSLLYQFWYSSRSSPAKSCHPLPSPLLLFLRDTGWVLGFNIWRPRNRYKPPVIGLPRMINFCNLGNSFMWRVHPCPYYDSASACLEERLVREGIDWSFTLPSISAHPSISLFLSLSIFFPCQPCRS